MPKARKNTTYIGRDGSRTIVPDMSGDEMRSMLDQVGLSELNKHSPDLSRMDPLALIAGFQQFEKLSGIRRLAPRTGDGLNELDDLAQPKAQAPDVANLEDPDGEIDFGL